jgi:hypothetical protein
MLLYHAFPTVMALFLDVLTIPLLNTGKILCEKSFYRRRRKQYSW